MDAAEGRGIRPTSRPGASARPLSAEGCRCRTLAGRALAARPARPEVADAGTASGALVRWIRDNAAQYARDPDRIAAWGESAGGHLAVLLATTAGDPGLDSTAPAATSSRIQAAVNYFGPGRQGTASALRYISPDDAPVLTVHGSADQTVSPGRSELLDAALRSAGVQDPRAAATPQP
jgi:acetyl esterase/lipase